MTHESQFHRLGPLRIAIGRRAGLFEESLLRRSHEYLEPSKKRASSDWSVQGRVLSDEAAFARAQAWSRSGRRSNFQCRLSG